MFFEPGDLIDRFRIIKRLDSGGMGDVYLALDTDRFVNVALKVLFPEADNYKKLLKRFALEAELYKKIAHPNIVGMIAAGEVNGIHYIALEHIRGTSLAQILIERGVLPVELAESVLVDLIYALNAAHQADVIHRDIKPQNIMITKDNVARLIDFGVAKETAVVVPIDADRSIYREELKTPKGHGITSGGSSSGDTTGGISSTSGGSTSKGAVVGTLAYCSPEQLQCQKIDGRTDIFSLGLVFYEMFTGLRPVAGHTAADILLSQSKMDTKLVLPTSIEPRIRPEIEAMILKMIRYRPEERYQTSLELIDEINRLKLGQQLSTPNNEIQVRSKELATRELADTFYWKATSRIDQGLFRQALEDFRKLLHVSSDASDRMIANITNHVDLIFWIQRPFLAALDEEIPGDRSFQRVNYLSYIGMLCELTILYRLLKRPMSSILSMILLLRRLDELIREGRHDMHETACSIIDGYRRHKEFKQSTDSVESFREGGVSEDLALERALTQMGERNPDTRKDLLLHRAVLLLALHEDNKARSLALEVLSMDDKNLDALSTIVTILAERGIRLPNDMGRQAVFLEIYLLCGLYDSAAVEMKRNLHGDISDLAVYQQIVGMFQRAGREHDLWMTYFQMANLLLEADYPERCHELLARCSELAPRSAGIGSMIKGMKNIHKVFSIQELSRLGA